MGSGTLINLIIKDSRRTFSTFLAMSIGMILVALYMEHFLQLQPCILCYMQRGAVILVGIVAAIGLLINPKKIVSYKVLISGIFLSSLTGALLAARQLYLQNLPADMVPSCVPDIDYLFSTLPFLEILILALTGDGNCAEVLWSFMGISIPGWVLIALIFFMIYCFLIFKNIEEIHSHK